MKSLVVGLGSIGRRHAEVLQALGHDVAGVSRRHSGAEKSYADIVSALDRFRPDYVVIATETSEHAASVRLLADSGYSGSVMVEKPLTGPEPADALVPMISGAGFRRFGVAYNLRFHPVLVDLRGRLAGAKIYHVSAACGQHLPDWRPGRDHRTGYSASRGKGGGVLRDLSHEIDYLLWLFGPVERVAAIGGNLGVLDIQADELWSVLLGMSAGHGADLKVDYLRQPAERRIVVYSDRGTMVADLIEGTLEENGKCDRMPVERNRTYSDMHVAMLSDDHCDVCTFEDALRIDGLIHAVETAAGQGSWVAA